MAMLASCAKDPPKPHTLVCATFSFRVANRAEIIQARKDFFDASILIRRNFSDTSITSTGAELAPWSYTHAEIELYSGGRTRIVLGGHSDYPKGGDPASDMRVYLFAESDPGSSNTCDKHMGALYAQVKTRMAQSWPIKEDADVPYRLERGKRIRVAD
ncbi:hypothetical protein [Luteimonas cucumeris]|uniref:hypothetical protein n=1 Tax=Luteimonas cucumeris TaxID=985012 RepID=UPI0011AA1C71|nr:hypothetical protein [Luteimonas cucumeris]